MEAYLQRAVQAIGPECTGAVLTLDAADDYPLPEQVMALWHALQDKHGG